MKLKRGDLLIGLDKLRDDIKTLADDCNDSGFSNERNKLFDAWTVIDDIRQAVMEDDSITSSTVYSDSFDEMVQKDFAYKGNKYTWNDSDCLYYNDNGDEDDYFMEIPEGAITSSKAIKSAVDPQIDELERRAHYALPYDNEITILNRDDKLVIKVALKDDIKRIRGEQAANVIFAKLQGDNKFMRMLDNLVHNDKEVECIVYDPDTNERFASINF